MSGRYGQYMHLRPSGEQWLRQIPADWEAARLKTLFKIRKDIAGRLGFDVLSVTQRGLKQKDLTSGEGQLSMDYSKYQVVAPDDFVMNHMDLLTGFIDIASQEGVTSPDYRVFVPHSADRMEARYYLYIFQMCYLNRIFYPLGQGSAQLGRWRLPRKAFEGFVLPIPSLEEQTQIAKFLDYETLRIDALIEKQQQLITLLKEKRQAVISHAVTKGLNPDVPMRDSGVEWLGEVPAHWEVKRLKHICEGMIAGPFGSSLTKDKYATAGVRVYGQEQVIPGDFSVGDYYISQSYALELKRYRVRPGDVLISCVGTFGKVAVVPTEAEPGIINPRLIRARLRNEVVPDYLAEVLRSTAIARQFDLLSRGGTMGVINIGILSEVVVALPPRDEQQVLLAGLRERASKLDELLERAEVAVGLLRERRTALISAAVTGKIDIRNWRAPDD